MKIANCKLRIATLVHGFVLALLLFAGCASNNTPTPSTEVAKPTIVPEATVTNVAAAPETAERDLEAERSALLEADVSFSRTSEEKGAAQAFYEFFAADGMSLSSGEPPIRGRDAIKIHLSAGPRGFLTWQPTAAEVAKSGDLGFTWGTAVFQGKGEDEKPRIGHSKYVSIWRKQSDGSWKVVVYSTSPNPAPAERRQ